jgi:hypothetical protein
MKETQEQSADASLLLRQLKWLDIIVSPDKLSEKLSEAS